MKNSDKLRAWEIAALIALGIFLLSGVFARAEQDGLSGRVIRLHVLAASDSAGDQETKLRVRDAVLEELTPALEAARGSAEASAIIAERLPALEKVAASVSGGEAHAFLARENYPTREYEDFALPAGEYTSLRIVLGEGEGHNWWCVVYPPLCTASAQEAVETGLLSEEDGKLITGESRGWVLRFRLIEWWERLFTVGIE